MDSYDKINEVYSKAAINSRAIEALYAILNNELVPTKTDLAAALGSKPAKFSEILNGRMKMGVDMIAVICDEFDVDPYWLLMGRGHKIFRIPEKQEPFFTGDLRSDELDRAYPHKPQDQIEAEAIATVLDYEKRTNPSQYDSMAEMFYNKTLEQAELIGQLRHQITELERQLGKNADSVDIGNTANVG